MKKPWQIWAVFALALCVVVPAMVWLTMQISDAERARVVGDREREVDRAETEVARQRAELQERINSALYRMDWWATPLVAQEAARPYYLYKPFYRVCGSTPESESGSQFAEVEQPSPLLFGTSKYVVLHFQIDENDVISSPQRPTSIATCEQALDCGVSNELIVSNDLNLGAAKDFCSYQAVSINCPSLPNSQADVNNAIVGQIASNNFQTLYRDPSATLFSNGYGNYDMNNALLPANNEEGLGIGESTYSRGGKGTKSELQQNRNMSRGNREYAQRAQTAGDNVEQQWIAQQQLNPNPVSQQGLNQGIVREGVMRPVWIDGKLLLVRRVESEDEKLVQCCWLDWEKIKEKLKSEIEDLIPDAEFEPIDEPGKISFDRAMATLPVQLVVDSQKLLSTLAITSETTDRPKFSGLKLSMILAWVGLLVAAVSSAFLLKGVIKLSERRAAFVSAVTHELRTPLTTFKMYSEMMAEDMVPEDRKTEYAKTLKVEADRLSNLVENVLQFARLEKGSCNGRMEQLAMQDLFGRFQCRLDDRAEKMGMDLSVDLGDTGDLTITTDPGKVEQVVFNLVDNACKYAQVSDNKRIEVTCKRQGGNVQVAVQDFGPGVTGKFKRLLFKPFCKSDQDAADTASGVGLGLALCQRMATSIGGKVKLVDCAQGARFVFEFPQK